LEVDIKCIILHPEAWSGKVLRNIGVLSQHYTASQLRRRRLESLPPWRRQISYTRSRLHL